MTSGNESYNLGLSNGISEFLESVAKAKTDPYSVISAEDLLGRVTRYNDRNDNGKKNIENIYPRSGNKRSGNQFI